MEIKERYTGLLTDLQNYLDFAIDVSDATAGRKGVPWRQIRAHQFYIRMTVTCMSLLRLLPGNRIARGHFDFWDFPAVANLTRTFIEAYHNFFYVGVDNVNDDESKFRLSIFNYYVNVEKYRLYTEFGVPEAELQDFKINIPMARKSLEDDPLFGIIPDNLKKPIKNGKVFMYLTQNQVAQRLSIPSHGFAGFYRFLSNQIHATPFSVFSQSDTRGRGLENEIEVIYIVMCMDFVLKYLVMAIDEMINIFPDCESKLDAAKLNVIRGILSEMKHVDNV
ncbi:MAG: DUF5677 domain-containing protein [Chryseolinea sp.]